MQMRHFMEIFPRSSVPNVAPALKPEKCGEFRFHCTIPMLSNVLLSYPYARSIRISIRTFTISYACMHEFIDLIIAYLSFLIGILRSQTAIFLFHWDGKNPNVEEKIAVWLRE